MVNTKDYFRKNIGWIIGAIIFLYPFYYPLIFELPRFSFETLYTFGLPRNEFMTVWMVLGGIIVVVFNIIVTNKHISDQEEQINIQLQQIQIQQKQRNDQLYRWEEQDKQLKKALTEQRKQFETQIEKQNEQIEIGQKQLRDNRFSSGVNLLGNKNESIRMGGAYNLYFLARDFDEYRKCVCEILCGHIRTITSKMEYLKKHEKKPSNEIQTILNLLFQKQYELIFDECKKNLEGVTLNGAIFSEAVISDVNFVDAILCNVNFDQAVCNKLDFLRAKLKHVKFGHTSLRNLNFWYTAFNNVDFSDAEFVRQSINFRGTLLEHIPYEEITKPGHSLELTNPTEEKNL
jgi:uncharacterized protein YjbI with pentapeptide repeats